jgi:hypothetical protein
MQPWETTSSLDFLLPVYNVIKVVPTPESSFVAGKALKILLGARIRIGRTRLWRVKS